MAMKSALAMAVRIAGSNSFTLSEVTSTMGTESKSEVPEELVAIVSDFGVGVANKISENGFTFVAEKFWEDCHKIRMQVNLFRNQISKLCCLLTKFVLSITDIYGTRLLGP